MALDPERKKDKRSLYADPRETGCQPAPAPAPARARARAGGDPSWPTTGSRTPPAVDTLGLSERGPEAKHVPTRLTSPEEHVADGTPRAGSPPNIASPGPRAHCRPPTPTHSLPTTAASVVPCGQPVGWIRKYAAQTPPTERRY